MSILPNTTSNSPRVQARRGITLIEMLVVIAVISLIMGVAYPSVSRGLESVRLRMASDDLASFLSLAMNRVEKLESPVEVRFLGAQRMIEIGGPSMAVKTLKLPDGIGIGEIYPAIPGDAQTERSVLLMPGAPFPRLTIELTSQGGGRRVVRIDPATSTPIIDEIPRPQTEAGRK